MDRRKFLQTTGLTTVTAVAAVAGRSAVAQNAEKKMEPKNAPRRPVKKLPPRSKVAPADTWDLSSLFPNDEAWEKAFAGWKQQIADYKTFRGKLADSPESLAACLKFDLDFSRLGDRLGNYAHLKEAEDETNTAYQDMMGRLMKAGTDAGEAGSFIMPEIMGIPDEKMKQFLDAPALAPYKLLLQRILRLKPHTLTDKEERLLAMQGEVAGSATQIFGQLTDADFKFGAVTDEKGQQVELSHGSLSRFQNSPDRDVRRTAFHQYFAQFKAHEHALAATLNASMQRDIYYSKVRDYKSAREASMFPDHIPTIVYDNLIASIHHQLPALYHYYDVRRRKMGLTDIHQYDIYVPIVTSQRVRRDWNQSVEVIMKGLQPLGDDYCSALRKGLTEARWCDRYENIGKKSGAFSSGSYDGLPYILINYQPEVLDSLFTLAHEGGHSMHSHYSCKTQPYAYHQYSIFVAEVASTFNETLLSRQLLKEAADNQQRAYLINHEIDSIRQTIFRQTMFAEFEKLAHASAEEGRPLTLDRFTEIYRGLLQKYFGPDFSIDDDLALECFRIPHFYRAFYVYKYATSMSAAIALVDRVLGGGRQELDDYLALLKGGCSKDPLELLRDAGVDMEKPNTVDGALARFGQLVNELDTLI
jgi:oligoendopeptidase F